MDCRDNVEQYVPDPEGERLMVIAGVARSRIGEWLAEKAQSAGGVVALWAEGDRSSTISVLTRIASLSNRITTELKNTPRP